MYVTFEIQLDINDSIEKQFLQWYDKLDLNTINDKKRLKDAILTGYFINDYGVNEYYKRYYENDFKSACEANVLIEIENAMKEKQNIERRLTDTINTLKAEHDHDIKKLQIVISENTELQTTIEQLQDKMKEDKNKSLQELADFLTSKKEKEVELIKLSKDSRILELEGKVERLCEELEFTTQKKDETIKEFRERELKSLQEKMSIEVDNLKETKSSLENQISYFKNLAEEKDCQLRNAFKNEIKEKMKDLEQLLMEKEAELRTLKTCNFVKGFTGENLILSFLRETYPKHEVQHTGKIAHEGDIHFKDIKDETVIVIESKYKQNITRDDVDKFSRDVSTVCQKDGCIKCIGGLFVSLLTRNIPGKGDAYVEMVGNVPVMFLGFTSVDEFNLHFGRYFEMFNTLCTFYKGNKCTSNTSSQEEIFDELNFYFNMFVKNKTRVEEFRLNCMNKINKFVGDIEMDNKTLLERIESLLKKNNCLKVGNSMHCCERCGELFSAKRLLTKHIKTCNK
jgi:hypothetical protein